MSENEELSLPRATVQKILSEILPNDTCFTKEAREALIECCINFIMIVATESNDIAEQDLKKTISTDHVIRAIETLGFDNYIPILQEFVESCRNNAKIKEKRKESKFVKSGLTEEELLAKQQELFKASRERLNK
jgi:histone H3/H4